MTTLTEHISRFFKDNSAEEVSFFDGYTFIGNEEYDLNSDLQVSPYEDLAKLGISHSIVKSHGGEGQGDEYYKVYKFTLGSEFVYVMFSGFYQSYHGSEHQDTTIVEPREVTVIEYTHVGNLK